MRQCGCANRESSQRTKRSSYLQCTVHSNLLSKGSITRCSQYKWLAHHRGGLVTSESASQRTTVASYCSAPSTATCTTRIQSRDELKTAGANAELNSTALLNFVPHAYLRVRWAGDSNQLQAQSQQVDNQARSIASDSKMLSREKGGADNHRREPVANAPLCGTADCCPPPKTGR